MSCRHCTIRRSQGCGGKPFLCWWCEQGATSLESQGKPVPATMKPAEEVAKQPVELKKASD